MKEDITRIKKKQYNNIISESNKEKVKDASNKLNLDSH